MPSWRKSSHSASNGNCAEVGQDQQVIAVRDTKNPGGPALLFSPTAWGAFLAGQGRHPGPAGGPGPTPSGPGPL